MYIHVNLTYINYLMDTLSSTFFWKTQIFPLGLLHKLQVRRIAKTSNIKMLEHIEREC